MVNTLLIVGRICEAYLVLRKTRSPNMDRKEAAQKLLDIANAIDRQAAEDSFFVCRSCNHTASLATINDKRVKVASEQGAKEIDAVSVNDIVACPACGSDMRYIPTEISERYYVEAMDGEDEENPPKAPPIEEEVTPAAPEDKAKPAPTPVPDPAIPPAPAAPAEEAPADAIEPTSESAPEDEPPAEGEDDEELSLDYGDDEGVEEPLSEPSSEPSSKAPAEEMPAEEQPPLDVAPEGEPPAEPMMGLEPPAEPKKPPKKKDRPDDGKPNIPKDRVPKFEFPKKAADEVFMGRVSRYMH